MEPNDQTLTAILNFVKWATCDYDRSSHGFLVDVFEKHKWTKNADGALRRQNIGTPTVHRLIEVLKQINEELWSNANTAVQKDPLFAPYIGGMVGTEMRGAAFSADNIIYPCIASQITPEFEFVYDEDRLKVKYAELRRGFSRETIPVTILVPLPGLMVALPGKRFDLSPNIAFGEFSDQDFCACANSGIVNPLSEHFPVIDARNGFGCRVVVDLPAVREPPGTSFGGLPEMNRKNLGFGELVWWAFDEFVEAMLFTLRLAGSVKIVAPGAMLFVDEISGRYSSPYRRVTAPSLVTSYTIDEITAKRITELWEVLAKSKHKRRLPRICSRRFNASLDRLSVEDAIVDITIAAEALFLSDQQNNHGEMGYRLRLRAAKFLQSCDYDPQDVASTMAKAYELRSTVVHGGELAGKVKLGGKDFSTDEFLLRVIHMMRDALATGATEYAADASFATTAYWENLVIGSRTLDGGGT